MTASDAELQAQDFVTRPRPGEPGEGLAAWKQYVRWYLAGQVYRCGTPRVIQNTGINIGILVREHGLQHTGP